MDQAQLGPFALTVVHELSEKGHIHHTADISYISGLSDIVLA